MSENAKPEEQAAVAAAVGAPVHSTTPNEKATAAPEQSAKPDKTLVDRIIEAIKNCRLAALLIVFGVLVIAIGHFSDAIGKTWDLINRFKRPPELSLAEVSKMAIPSRFVVSDMSGDIAVKPVALIRAKPPEWLGTEAETYLVCRFSNRATHPITIGEVADNIDEEKSDFYRLDDVNLPVLKPRLTSLAQWQIYIRGWTKADQEEQQEKRRRLTGSNDAVALATIQPGETKYAFVNLTGGANTTPLIIFDAFDNIVGRATVNITRAAK